MAIQSSMVKMTKMSKMHALAGAFAIAIARKNNDPNYVKMMRFKKAYKLTKKQLMVRYGTKGLMAARQAAMKS